MLTIAVSVYHIAKAEDKVRATANEVTALGSGLAGSAALGTAGLTCGPAALICVPLVHLRANTDNIDPILPLGIILPQMNANQRKWGDIDSPLSTVPDRFAFIGVDLRLNLL